MSVSLLLSRFSHTTKAQARLVAPLESGALIFVHVCAATISIRVVFVFSWFNFFSKRDFSCLWMAWTFEIETFLRESFRMTHQLKLIVFFFLAELKAQLSYSSHYSAMFAHLAFKNCFRWRQEKKITFTWNAPRHTVEGKIPNLCVLVFRSQTAVT